MVNKEIMIPSLLKIGRGKIVKIGKYLADRSFNNAAVFYGEGIKEILGKQLEEGFKNNKIIIVHENLIKDVNIENIVKTAFKIPTNTNVLVGLGGGKALDYSKYCAHILKLPFISVPTTVSNDGFCSPNASLLVGGKRKSVKSSIPYGVVADLDIITKAPEVSLFSGLGDMISKVTALWDWRSAFKKGLSDFNDFAALISHNSLDILYEIPRADLAPFDLNYKLVNSLLLSGIAMEIAGSSRPASGSEHLISHALDSIQLCPRHMHGLQVGAATCLCAKLQENHISLVDNFLVNTGFISFLKQNPIDKKFFIKALQIAPKIKENYYTILSEPSSYDRAIKLLEEDTILKQIIY